MSKGCIFILSVSSDIGHALALSYVADGYEVVGTYRNRESVADLAQEDRIQLLHCDIASRESIHRMIIAYKGISKPWDIFISCVGTMEPIGPFFAQDFEAWEESIKVNSTAQLRVLHGIYPYRLQGPVSYVVFFAGGGTNSAFANYSAYAASKLLLIKMCELLDDECEDLSIFIIGPGFRKTKIHRQTFENSAGAGRNLERTLGFFRSSQTDNTYKDIYYFINRCIFKGKSVVSGRNFSVLYDFWHNGHRLEKQLLKDPEKFKLRRFNGKEA